MAYNNLSIGSSGEEVKKLQNSLIQAGYDVGSTGADGQFGSATQAAVRQYQQNNGLAADGIAGDNTLSKLYGTGTQTTTPAASAPAANPVAPAKTFDPSMSPAYQQAITALQAVQKSTPTFNNTYDGQLKDLYDQIVNRDKFSYDINSDMLYQQYAQQYADMGKMAMMDTMGQAAALTGGYGSSYGQAVGQQQYDAYLQRLNDVIPELYGQAYQQYRDEGNDMLQQYAMLGDLDQQEYARYEDEYNRWLNERNYAQGQADDAYDRGFKEWAAAQDQYNIDREYQLALEKWQYQKDQDAQAAAAAASRGSSGGGGGGGDYTAPVYAEEVTEPEAPPPASNRNYTYSDAVSYAREVTGASTTAIHSALMTPSAFEAAKKRGATQYNNYAEYVTAETQKLDNRK